MQIFDVSVPLRRGIPTWRNADNLALDRVRLIEEGANSNSSILRIETHTGTHLDPPLHFLPGASGVDRVPLDACYGPALVVAVEPRGRHVTASDLEAASIPPDVERLLLKTANSALWADPTFHEDFIAIEEDAASWLTGRGVRLVGIDYLSIAPFGRSREVHVELLSQGCLVLEGLDLSGVEPGEYALCALPLRIVEGDGSPVRAVLIRE